MSFDALILGGGPAGSTAAIALSRRGWKVALIEKAEFPRRKVCGEFVSATSLAVIEAVGLGEEWKARAGPEVRRVALFSGERVVTARMPAAHGAGFGRALGRDVLDDLLVQEAVRAGATLFQPFCATEVTPNGDRQAVTIASRKEDMTLSAPIVIAAHGSWEPGRLPSQLEKTNRPSDLLGFKAHFSAARLDADLMPLLVFPGGYGGMVWADRGRLSLSLCIRRDAFAELRQEAGGGSASEAVHRHLLASCRGVREAIGEAQLQGRWLAAGPIRPGMRVRYRDDIFRIGNVAGESHPVIAEGISMAMQSAWLLAEELEAIDPAKRDERDAAGRRYSRRWREQFGARILAASAIAGFAVRPVGARLMGGAIEALPALLTLGARLSGKTKPLGISAFETA
ncbi:flavin-dependent dehydrogenase [Rhodopseudomonas julia]|uniref:Flavin-dependent dehydrogenase n=1 Tax=Rhodopseudomonas julia TaxID=200617 RepID=A0ABU0C7B1_9BRAD|nr:NAD(P)/FAD-dependent oxidoreductase [Rhodopseudomonas julia]MDQ0325791.1 flavin-dependent dehydrogenase [Rhodopseudomonas julia]